MSAYFTASHGTLFQGDSLAVLSTLQDESVQCCVTSPPYWGLRDYGAEGQIGLEDSPAEHIKRLLAVFREVYRVLKKDGTLWVNYGDTYLCRQGMGFNGNVRLDDANRTIKLKRPLPAKNLLLISLRSRPNWPKRVFWQVRVRAIRFWIRSWAAAPQAWSRVHSGENGSVLNSTQNTAPWH